MRCDRDAEREGERLSGVAGKQFVMTARAITVTSIRPFIQILIRLLAAS